MSSTHARMAELDHEIITRHQDPGGAYPACPTFSAYAGYCWLRDGAFIAEGISRYGDLGSASAFHDWTDRVLRSLRPRLDHLVAEQAQGRVPPDEIMLPTRFPLSGNGLEADTDWPQFQTDGYGTWLWAVVTHADRHAVDLARWRGGLELAVDYLCAFGQRPCFDWWEEGSEHRHVSTLASVYGGLVAVSATGVLDIERQEAAVATAERIAVLVARRGVTDGRLSKWLGGDAVDAACCAAVVPFGLLPVADPVAVATVSAVDAQLNVGGGVHRYLADTFYGGGQWLLLTALLGWNQAAQGNRGAATAALEWIEAQATADGELPEQVGHHLQHPGEREPWLRRWGPVATPLLWSHGMHLILADELGLA